MKEAFKNIFLGTGLGLIMSGFVLSIIEGRLLLASREYYWLLLFYISVLMICLICLAYLFKERLNYNNLSIAILTAVGIVISEILISMDLVLSYSF